MKDNIQNILRGILRDIRIAKLVYFKNCFFSLQTMLWASKTASRKSNFVFSHQKLMHKTANKVKYVQFIDTSSEQGDGYLSFTIFTK